MGKIKIVPAALEHVDLMKDNMRQQDIAEVKAASGGDIGRALENGIKISTRCWSVLLNDEPVGVFGVAPKSLLSVKGIPWLLGTNDIPKIKWVIKRKSKHFLNLMFQEFPVLENHVDVRNTLSVRWLKWMGFQFAEPQPYGVEGRPFMRFFKEKNDV